MVRPLWCWLGKRALWIRNLWFVTWASTMRVLIVSCLPQENDFFFSIPDENLHSFHLFFSIIISYQPFWFLFSSANENHLRHRFTVLHDIWFLFQGSTSLKDAVRPLRQQGVTTFIFRIGSEPGIQELYSAVESPDNVFTFSRFADMDSKVTDVARHIPFYSGMWAFTLWWY